MSVPPSQPSSSDSESAAEYAYVVPDSSASWSIPPEVEPTEVMTYRKHAYTGISLGLVTIMATLAVSYISSTASSCISFLATGLWVYSGWFTAKAKGYHPAWGLLGIAGIFGLIALSFFPDRYQFPLDASTKRFQMGLRVTLILLILGALVYVINI